MKNMDALLQASVKRQFALFLLHEFERYEAEKNDFEPDEEDGTVDLDKFYLMRDAGNNIDIVISYVRLHDRQRTIHIDYTTREGKSKDSKREPSELDPMVSFSLPEAVDTFDSFVQAIPDYIEDALQKGSVMSTDRRFASKYVEWANVLAEHLHRNSTITHDESTLQMRHISFLLRNETGIRTIPVYMLKQLTGSKVLPIDTRIELTKDDMALVQNAYGSTIIPLFHEPVLKGMHERTSRGTTPRSRRSKTRGKRSPRKRNTRSKR